jgi:ubiquinone/menaquinone biosynthesis C-methylase UbiE
LADGLMRVFGRQARKPSGWWGRMVYGHLAAYGHRPVTRWAMSFIDVQPSDRVLDIGCGSGTAIQLIARIATEGLVAGVDYSEDMVQQALRRNAAAVRLRRVEIRRGNVAALPYHDESFDKVIAVETFYFWPDAVPNLQEVRRVIRPGGLLALAMEGSREAPNPRRQAALAARLGFSLYSGAEMEGVLAAAGFSRAWFESAPDRGWGWLCALGVR